MKRIIYTNHLAVVWWGNLPREWRAKVSGCTVWLTLGKLTIDFGKYA